VASAAEQNRTSAMHAALADPARPRITDMLAGGDASPSELAAMVTMPSNLLAHHLRVLQEAGPGVQAPVAESIDPGAIDAARRHELLSAAS
jgi:Helix-turn-helix domain